MTIGIIMIKGVLLRSDFTWVTLIRTGAALLGMLVVFLIHPHRNKLLIEILPSPTWKWAVPGSVGNYLALLFWLAGMKYTLVSLAAILNQLSTIFIFLLAAFFLKERITPAKSIAVLLAISGAVIATRWSIKIKKLTLPFTYFLAYNITLIFRQIYYRKFNNSIFIHWNYCYEYCYSVYKIL